MSVSGPARRAGGGKQRGGGKNRGGGRYRGSGKKGGKRAAGDKAVAAAAGDKGPSVAPGLLDAQLAMMPGAEPSVAAAAGPHDDGITPASTMLSGCPDIKARRLVCMGCRQLLPVVAQQRRAACMPL